MNMNMNTFKTLLSLPLLLCLNYNVDHHSNVACKKSSLTIWRVGTNEIEIRDPIANNDSHRVHTPLHHFVNTASSI
jgi:hypothetical protein